MPYKPSNLSYGSPRSSPFRRPESPASPSPLRNSTTPLRNSTTPTTSPTKPPQMAHLNSTPSKLNQGSVSIMESTIEVSDSWAPRSLTFTRREPPTSPTRGANTELTPGAPTPIHSAPRPASDINALSKLQPAQVRELREGFQILDRDGDGVIGTDDVADMLNQLGLCSTASDLAPFFPLSKSQNLTLPAFLTQISNILCSLSPPAELLSAFSAFDDDDSGQIDLTELREALLHTMPDPSDEYVNSSGLKAMQLTDNDIDKVFHGFTGRRAFGKQSTIGMGMGKGIGIGKRGEVFRYREFVDAVIGGKGNKDTEE